LTTVCSEPPEPNNKDAEGIRAGVKARNGRIVLAGAQACARYLGKKQEWDKWTRGCSGPQSETDHFECKTQNALPL